MGDGLDQADVWDSEHQSWVERGWKRPALVHETDYLVRRSFPMQTVLRDVEVSMEATDQTRTDVDLWRRSALGQSRPFLIVPHQDEVDAWFVTFDNAEQSYQRTFQNVNAIQLTMRELSRGLQL